MILYDITRSQHAISSCPLLFAYCGPPWLHIKSIMSFLSYFILKMYFPLWLHDDFPQLVKLHWNQLIISSLTKLGTANTKEMIYILIKPFGKNRCHHRIALQTIWHEMREKRSCQKSYCSTDEMGFDVRKPVFGGLWTTQSQTSLRIRAVWSATLLFAFCKVSHVNMLQVKFHFSS